MVNNNDEFDLKKLFKIIGIGFFIMFGIIFLFNSFFTVQPNERAMIYSWNGGLKQEVYSEGLHFKIPIVNQVIKMNTMVQKQSEIATAATSDMQEVTTEVAVNFLIDPNKIQDIYRTIGGSTKNNDYMQSTVIYPIIQESVKSATAKYTAQELIKNRESIKKMIDDRIKDRLGSYNLIVRDVSITDFKFSTSYQKAIDDKTTNEQLAGSESNKVAIIEAIAKQKVAEQEGISNSLKISADAQAYSTKVKADAEAYSLQVIREQLEKNNALIQYKTIEKWSGNLPVYSMNSATPLINLPTTTN